jgi:putative alpha-1,2-mannosidase
VGDIGESGSGLELTVTGKLPDCRMSFCKGFTQGGSNADVVVAEAFIKNLREGIDWETAYEAVISDAEGKPVPRPYPSSLPL